MTDEQPPVTDELVEPETIEAIEIDAPAPPVDELPPGLLVRPTEGTYQNVQRLMRVIT